MQNINVNLLQTSSKQVKHSAFKHKLNSLSNNFLSQQKISRKRGHIRNRINAKLSKSIGLNK